MAPSLILMFFDSIICMALGVAIHWMQNSFDIFAKRERFWLICFFFIISLLSWLCDSRSKPNEGKKLLANLSKINRPLEITFKEMLNLMGQCDIVDRQSTHKIQTRSNDETDEDEDDIYEATFMNRQFPNSPFSLFSGIIPGECIVSSSVRRILEGEISRWFIDDRKDIFAFRWYVTQDNEPDALRLHADNDITLTYRHAPHIAYRLVLAYLSDWRSKMMHVDAWMPVTVPIHWSTSAYCYG